MDFEGFLIGAHKKLEDDSIASDYYGSFTGNSTLYQQLCGKNGVRNWFYDLVEKYKKHLK